jgi:hypothetical protein
MPAAARSSSPTGVTFEQAAIGWLRWDEHERAWKRSTLVDRRSVLNHHLLPEFGALPVNQITTRRVEAWKIAWLAEHDARRQGAKLLAILHGIMERAEGVRPAAKPGRGRRPASASATTPRALTSTHPRRSTRSRAARHPSRTPRCSSPPPSRDYAAASSSRCAGPTSTSRSAQFAWKAPSRTAQ